MTWVWTFFINYIYIYTSRYVANNEDWIDKGIQLYGTLWNLNVSRNLNPMYNSLKPDAYFTDIDQI